MIVAINKENQEKYLFLQAVFPVEEECLVNYFIFDFPDITNKTQAVRLAKIRRGALLAGVPGHGTCHD